MLFLLPELIIHILAHSLTVIFLGYVNFKKRKNSVGLNKKIYNNMFYNNKNIYKNMFAALSLRGS